MPITPHRAFSLAIASLGDTSRICDMIIPPDPAMSSELREASDYLASLRDQQPEQRSGLHVLETTTPTTK